MEGVIYKLVCGEDFYIGSTTDPYLPNRLSKHRDMGRKLKWNSALYRAMFERGANNFAIELVERVEGGNLRDREQYWIDTLHPTLNQHRAVRLESKEYNQQWYQANKETQLKKMKEYREANKETLNATRRQRVECPHCKKQLNSSYLSTHIKQKHP